MCTTTASRGEARTRSRNPAAAAAGFSFIRQVEALCEKSWSAVASREMASSTAAVNPFAIEKWHPRRTVRGKEEATHHPEKAVRAALQRCRSVHTPMRPAGCLLWSRVFGGSPTLVKTWPRRRQPRRGRPRGALEVRCIAAGRIGETRLRGPASGLPLRLLTSSQAAGGVVPFEAPHGAGTYGARRGSETPVAPRPAGDLGASRRQQLVARCRFAG